MPTIFIAHSSDAKAVAVKFKGILTSGAPDLEVFLSSDWDSIEAGSIWLQEIERALATHTHFIALITCPKDSALPWICYEVGFTRGRAVWRSGKRFVVHADEKLTAFLELESTIRRKKLKRRPKPQPYIRKSEIGSKGPGDRSNLIAEP